MSRAESQDGAVVGGGEEAGGDAAPIEDPDDYSLGRWLQAIHDARARVRRTARDARHRDVQGDQNYTQENLDRLVAEEVADLVTLLRAIERERDGDVEDFTGEQIELDGGGTVTVGDVANRRGQLPDENGYLPYQASMQAWSVCLQKLVELTSPGFTSEASPADNPVDPAGRFNE